MKLFLKSMHIWLSSTQRWRIVVHLQKGIKIAFETGELLRFKCWGFTWASPRMQTYTMLSIVHDILLCFSVH